MTWDLAAFNLGVMRARAEYERLAPKPRLRQPPGPKVDQARDLQIARLYLKGLTGPEIGARLGCGRTAVYGALRRTGTPLRPPHSLHKEEP